MKKLGYWIGLFVLLSLLLATQVAVPSYASGTIRHVAPTGLNSGTCSTWANACNLHRALVVVATQGDQLWVKQGTYKPGNLRGSTFTLRNGVSIYGGFAGTETVLSQRNPKTRVTILSGDIGIPGVATDNVYHVITAGGSTTNTAVLDGFTVRAGNANGGSSNDWGAGMFNAGGNPTLTNVIFTGNSADTGGGMFNYISSPTLTNVTFSNNHASTTGGGMFNELSSNPALENVSFLSNSAPNGAGMYNYGVSPTLNYVTFSGNMASVSGGGMYNDNGSNPTVTNVTFSGNSASTAGGGMFNDGSSPTLSKLTFSGNFADNGGGMYNTSSSPILTNVTYHANKAVFGYGGGMFNSSGSIPILTNATFSGNSASADGGAIYNDISSPRIYESIFWSDGTEITNNTSAGTLVDSILSGGGCPTGAICANVINSNPLLRPLAANGGYSKTMALGAGSPAIDSGGVNNTCAPTDQRGIKRPQGPACDMGAYEAPVSKYFLSIGSQDGFILETGENTNVGGTLNSSAPTLTLGDDASRKQYRSILSFNTASLPDNASIVSIKLQLKKSSVAPPSTNPIALLQGIMLDVKKGFFGSNSGLQASDFQSSANKTVGPYFPTLASGLYTITLNRSAFASVNKLATNGGLTQIRMRFKLDDNNNNIANTLNLFSANNLTASNRPALIIVYTTP